MSKTVTKIASAVIGLSMVAMLVPASAGAQSTTSTADANAQLVATLMQQIQALQAQLLALQGGTSGTPTMGGTTMTGCNFTQNFDLGASAPEVMEVQKFLNSDPATMVAATGVGSAGQETQYYGSLTKAAAVKFQEKYRSEILDPLGLPAGTGYWGSSSRAKANMLCNQVVVVPTPTPGTPTPTPIPGFGLGVAVNPAVPDFVVMPSNVSNALFSSFLLTAPATQSVEVTGLVMGRSGLGNRNDFQRVWVNVNGIQHTNERSLVTGDQASFDLTTNPIRIPAGQTVVVDMMGSFSSSAVAGHYNALGIKSITTAGDVPVNATFPLYGTMTTISSQTATEVKLTVQGSAQTISVGDKQVEIARGKFTVTSTADKDVYLMSMRLENEGTANNIDNILRNVKLVVNGENIASNIVLDGDIVTFFFDDYLIKDGQNKAFQILADIVSADDGETIALELDDDADLTARETDGSSGVRVIGDDAGSDIDPAKNVNFKIYTLAGGDINFALNDASSRSVAPGIDDVLLLDGEIIVDRAIQADGLFVRLQTGTDAGSTDLVSDIHANFENVTLLIDGLEVDVVDTLTNADGGAVGTAFATGTSGDYYDFDSVFTLDPGVHRVTVEADVKDDATAGEKIKLVIFSSDLQSAEYIDTGDNVPSGELTGQSDGSLITIQAAQVTVERNDGYASETFVSGTKNLEAFKFLITNNDSTDVNVTSMTFSLGTGDYPASFVTNMRLMIDGVQVGSPTDLSSGVFSGINFSVPRSQQVQAVLVVDTNTGTTSTTMRIDLDTMDAFDTEGNTATVKEGGADLSASNALQSDTINMSTGGTFTFTTDGNTADEDILIGDDGAVWYPVATYRLTAEDEALKVTDMYFDNATSTVDNTATSSHTDSRVITMGVFDEGGVLKSQKSWVSGLLHFDLGETENPSGIGAVIVPKDDFTKITIRAKLNTVNDADKTGRLLRLILSRYNGAGNENADGLFQGVIVQSTATGDDLASTSITAYLTSALATRATSTAADFFAIRRTKPTLTVSPQGSGETTLTNGSQKVLYRFSMSADANEDVAWKGVKFDLTGRFGGVNMASTTGATSYHSLASGATTQGFASSTGNGGPAFLTAFELFEVSTGQEIQNGNYTYQIDWDDTNDNGELAIVMDDTYEEVVGAGTSKEYELRATISGATTDGDFIDVAIDNQADDAASEAYLVAFSDPDEVDGDTYGNILMTHNATTTVDHNPYSVLWSDNSGSPHSLDNNNATADERDWTNDRFIQIDTSSWNRVGNFN